MPDMQSVVSSVFARALASALCVSMLLGAPAGPAHAHEAHAPDHGAAPTPAQTEWGVAARPRAATRTVEVRMGDDMRFSPARIEVRLGETLRFRVRNAGKLMHEFVIGTREGNQQHARMMMQNPGMAHDAPYMAHVPAGQTGEVVWTFNRAGQFEFACLIAGHDQAGMVGTITVKP